MKRPVSFLILIMLLLLMAFQAHAEFSRESWFSMGVSALEDGTPEAVAMAVDYFDAAGNYDQAKNYKQYCQYLLGIFAMDGEDADISTTLAGLKRLGKKSDFEESLQAHGFYSCELLVTYIETRRLEEKDEIVKAWHGYYAIDHVLDAGERMDALTADVYKVGLAKYAIGDYTGTIEALRDLDFENSEEILDRALKLAYPVPTPAPVYVGDTVTFGHYEQDNINNGKEPIEWLVLTVQGNYALLISRYNLDTQPYHTENASVTWETCSLREWLNDDFLNNAFTAEEQQFIPYIMVDNSQSQGFGEYDSDGGNNTADRIFVLSYAEASQYFSSDEERRSWPTEYAVEQGAMVHELSSDQYWRKGFWWLRSPGYSNYNVFYVNDDGAMHHYGVNIGFISVRPALWVDLNAGLK